MTITKPVILPAEKVDGVVYIYVLSVRSVGDAICPLILYHPILLALNHVWKFASSQFDEILSLISGTRRFGGSHSAK
jgi:hypothetical protein